MSQIRRGSTFYVRPLAYFVSTSNLKDHETPAPRVNLRDWHPVANEKSPSIFRWEAITVVAAGFMLYLSPVQSSSPMIARGSAVFLSLVVFKVGWETARSMFALHCKSYRLSNPHKPLRYLFPVFVAVVVSLGLVGGRWWWLFSVALAILGHRKGMQRAFWSAVVSLAFCLRCEDTPGLPPLASNDDEALKKAVEAISNEAWGKSRP